MKLALNSNHSSRTKTRNKKYCKFFRFLMLLLSKKGNPSPYSGNSTKIYCCCSKMWAHSFEPRPRSWGNRRKHSWNASCKRLQLRSCTNIGIDTTRIDTTPPSGLLQLRRQSCRPSKNRSATTVDNSITRTKLPLKRHEVLVAAKILYKKRKSKDCTGADPYCLWQAVRIRFSSACLC